MPTVNLHIGAGKCGSSLIQRLQADADVQECLKQDASETLSKVLMSTMPCFQFDDYNYQVILEQIRSTLPQTDLFVSCENFFGAHTHREESYTESIKCIRYLFRDFDDIRLLMYVRRQDQWIEAMYNQDVKRQETRDFEDYFSEILLDNLRWDDVANAYGDHFDLTVLPFEKKVLNTANIENFVYGMFKWLGAEVEIEELPVINPSLTPAGMGVQMLANRTMPKELAYDLSFWLERHAAKKPSDKFEYFKDRPAILDRFRDSNAALFEKWMKDFNPSYYLE